jgi:hypothetical protein
VHNQNLRFASDTRNNFFAGERQVNPMSIGEMLPVSWIKTLLGFSKTKKWINLCSIAVADAWSG